MAEEKLLDRTRDLIADLKAGYGAACLPSLPHAPRITPHIPNHRPPTIPHQISSPSLCKFPRLAVK